jgi:N-acetyl-gamma-glutamyl-phosphate reductase
MHNHAIARVGVLGATGYTGRELLRLLADHPRVRIAFATSEREAGACLSSLVAAAPELPLVRADDAPLGDCDVVVSCLPHGESMVWMERARAVGVRAIDLAADLRVPDAETPAWAAEVVYGLTELHRAQVAEAELVANPGCYPTAAILALAPLLRRGLARGPVVINAASGVTGAGRAPRADLLFAEVAESFAAYAAGNVHRHLAELRAQTEALGNGSTPELVFTPHLLPIRRGILETIYVPLAEPLDAPLSPWLDDYASEPYVRVLKDRLPSVADAVGTNQVVIGAVAVRDVSQPMLIVVAAIDNLLKGAAGQAVQNLNLMLGWAETEGLP